MADFEDSDYQKNLRAWLIEQKNQSLSVAVATRAAWRLQPSFWFIHPPVGKVTPDDLTLSLVSIKTLLLGTLYTVLPNQNVIQLADENALSAVQFTKGWINNAISPVALPAVMSLRAAARSVIQEVRRDGTFDADGTLKYGDGPIEAAAAVAAQAVFVFDYSANGLSAQMECEHWSNGLDVWDLPLWTKLPDDIAKAWSETRDGWENAGAPWDYFAEVYDALLKGTQPDWTILRQVALISPSDWDAGPDQVAACIAAILAKSPKPAQPKKPAPEVIRQFADTNAETLPAQLAALI
ncbi:MAG: hypothetical protein AAGF71_04680 [Pseudomonadota bacterium]